MAENKDIKDQIDAGAKKLKSETKTGIGIVNEITRAATANISAEAKSAKKDLREFGKQTRKEIKDAGREANSEIKSRLSEAKKQINDISTEAASKVSDTIKQATADAIDDVDSRINEGVSGVERVVEQTKKNALRTIKEVVDQQKKRLAEQTKTTPDQKQQATDLTTKLLQDILSEVKVIRKVVEKRVEFDPKSGRYRGAGGKYVKESDVREAGPAGAKKEEDKSKRGFFKDIRSRFVAVKEQTKQKLAPVAGGAKEIKEGMGGLLSNPLVIAGLLAFLAPKELLSFLKGFLGEMLFGENANAFTQGFTAFVALWSGFKIYNAFKNLIKVIRGLWTVGKFLFTSPAVLGLGTVLGLILGVAQIMSNFKQKYGERETRKSLEQELSQLETKQYAETEEGNKQKAADEERKKQIKAEVEQLGKKGVYSTTGQATKAALTREQETVDPNNNKVKEAVAFIADYDTAIEKQKAGQPLSKNEQTLLKEFKSKDDIFSVFPEFSAPEKRNIIQDLANKKRKPVAVPPAPTSAAPTPAAGPAPTSSGSAQAAPPSALPSDTKQKPAIEAATPSIGQMINNASVDVNDGYEQAPEDSTTVVAQDQTQIPKEANVIDTIPGVYANRSSLIAYEMFNVSQLFAMA